MTGVGTRWKHFIYDRVTSFHSVVVNETNRLIVGYGLWMTSYEFCSDIAGSNHREHFKPFLRVFHVRFLVLSAKIEKLRKFYINPMFFILFGQEIVSNHEIR